MFTNDYIIKWYDIKLELIFVLFLRSVSKANALEFEIGRCAIAFISNGRGQKANCWRS